MEYHSRSFRSDNEISLLIFGSGNKISRQILEVALNYHIQSSKVVMENHIYMSGK